MKVAAITFLFVMTLNLSFAQKLYKTYQGHQNKISDICFSPTSKSFATGSMDKTIKIWNLTSTEAVKTLSGHNGVVLSVNYSPDGKSIVSSAWDGSIKIWDVATGTLVKSIDNAHSFKSEYATYNKEGNTIVSAGIDSVKLWNASNFSLIKKFKAHKEDINFIRFSRDGKRFATCGWDKTIKLWSFPQCQLVKTFTGNMAAVNTVYFSSDDQFLISSSDDGEINVWEIETGNVMTISEDKIPMVNSICVCANNKYIAASTKDLKILLIDYFTESIVASISDSKPISRLSFSPDGNYIAYSTEAENSVKIYDVSSLKYQNCIDEKMIEFAELNAPKKDDETLQDYQKRTAEYKKKRDIARSECIKEEASRVQDEKRIKMEEKNPVFQYSTFKIESISAYNEATQDYGILVNGTMYNVKMPPAEAKTFLSVWQKAVVKGITRTFPTTKKTDLINLEVIHPKTKKSYPFGTQVSKEKDKYLNKFLTENPPQ
jgi:tricorn protease-like protein